MADNVYTSRIKSNTKMKDLEFQTTLNQLKNDIKGLNSTVDKAVNDELDRLVPMDEKERIMNRDGGQVLSRKIGALKPSDFFKYTGIDAYDPIYDSYADSAVKPSDVEMPAGFNKTIWEGMNSVAKKNAYITDLKTNKDSKYEELVFKAMPENEKIAAVTANPDIYFDMLSPNEKLMYIAQYSRREDETTGNRQKFKDKLGKAQQRKDQMKASIKNKANTLINSMNQVIEMNKREIEKLKEEITRKTVELQELQNKPIDINEFAAFYNGRNKGTTPPDIDTLKKMAEAERDKSIQNLQKNIDDLNKDLRTAMKAQEKAVETLNNSIKEIENTLAEKDIYVGSQSISEKNKDVDAENVPATAYNTVGNVVSNPNLSQRKKAKNMLKNFMETGNVEGLRLMIHQHSYEDLMAMAIQLGGPFNKANLSKMYDIAFTDMRRADKGEKLNAVKALLATKGLKLKNLRDMNDLDEKQVRDIQEILTDLNSNYSNKTQKEQEEIDLLMDYVKIGMLKRQTEHFRGLKNLFRPREKKLRMKMLTSQLEEHARNQFDEQNSTLDEYNSFRKLLKQPAIDKSRKKAVQRVSAPERNKVVDHEL